MKSRRLTGTATSMMGLLGGAHSMMHQMAGRFRRKKSSFKGLLSTAKPWRVDSPDLRDVFVEGPIVVDVSIDEAPPGKDRLWTNDHVEATALGLHLATIHEVVW